MITIVEQTQERILDCGFLGYGHSWPGAKGKTRYRQGTDKGHPIELRRQFSTLPVQVRETVFNFALLPTIFPINKSGIYCGFHVWDKGIFCCEPR